MSMKAGMQIANSRNLDTDFGTLGGAVLNLLGQQVFLTCFHCVFTHGMFWRDTAPRAGYEKIKAGENDRFQPDTGQIVQLLRDDRVDIALLQAAAGQDIETDIPVFGATNGIAYLSDADTGIWLRKYGAVSKDTYGQFEGFAPFGFKYREESSVHELGNLITIRTSDGSSFSEKGDSGSFVMNDRNQVVGVIVMGNGNTSYAIQSAIIVSRLNIKFT